MTTTLVVIYGEASPLSKLYTHKSAEALLKEGKFALKRAKVVNKHCITILEVQTVYRVYSTVFHPDKLIPEKAPTFCIVKRSQGVWHF